MRKKTPSRFLKALEGVFYIGKRIYNFYAVNLYHALVVLRNMKS